MARIDLNKAFKTSNWTEDGSQKTAANATSFMIDGLRSMDLDGSRLDIRSIPIEKIRPREVNEFGQTNIDALAESIRLYGLINPLSVVYHPDEDVYIISSGHRRYEALTRLHKEYPNDDAFSHIDCAVYEVTTDKVKLAQGLPFIRPEQEEGIYRDSNLENRQLTYSDVAHQIRYLVRRFDDETYVARLRERAVELGLPTRAADFDKTKLIMSVLSQSRYEGWGRETIRQYLKVQEAGREDLLDAIEEGGITVKSAYKLAIADNKKNRNRKTNKIAALKKNVNAVIKEAETRTYTAAERDTIRTMIRALEEILENQE